MHTYTHTYLLNLPFCNPTWPPSFFSAGDGGGDKPGQARAGVSVLAAQPPQKKKDRGRACSLPSLIWTDGKENFRVLLLTQPWRMGKKA